MKYDCSIDNKIACICENQWQYFFYKPNVVGVALGYKITKGFVTNEKCIKVFVIKKVFPNLLRESELIPTNYKGFKTDVKEIGIIKPQSLTRKIRPVLQGYDIGIQFDSGTTGCVVTDGLNWYILSNNHVLADENKAPIGSKIIQPSSESGGDFHTDVVAELSKYIKLRFKNSLGYPTNYVDCAIGKVIDKSMVSPEVALVGNIKGTDSGKLNDNVMKVGKTTELTNGIITDISATIFLNYRYGKVMLKNQVITTKMSEEGDSGSVLLNNNGYAVGLITAGTNNTSAACSMKTILKKLGVNIVTH